MGDVPQNRDCRQYLSTKMALPEYHSHYALTLILIRKRWGAILQGTIERINPISYSIFFYLGYHYSKEEWLN